MVTLPLARSFALSPPPADVASARARLDGMRVLVVDDDRDGSALAEAILTSAGAVVRVASSAADAFELLRRWRPDVLVSDIEMPAEDGPRTSKRAQRSAHLRC